MTIDIPDNWMHYLSPEVARAMAKDILAISLNNDRLKDRAIKIAKLLGLDDLLNEVQIKMKGGETDGGYSKESSRDSERV